jgi:hypothetical protein
MRLRRGRRSLALWAVTTLALAVAPLHVVSDGFQVAKAYAGKGGGNGGGGGNSGGGGGGNSGGGNSGGGNGNSGNGNSGNGNGNNGNGNNGNQGNGRGQGNSSGDVQDHVNTATGDKVEVSADAVEVTHSNGMKEKVEKGRFRMEDKYGRVIVDRKATAADIDRLKSL